MKTEAVSKFLDVLREHVHDQDAESEIDSIRNKLNTCQDISRGVEVLCRGLSLAFTLSRSEPLWSQTIAVCMEALSWNSDKEQILDAVKEFLECESISQIDSFCIRSLLLLATEDSKRAGRLVEEAQKYAADLVLLSNIIKDL